MWCKALIWNDPATVPLHHPDATVNQHLRWTISNIKQSIGERGDLMCFLNPATKFWRTEQREERQRWNKWALKVLHVYLRVRHTEGFLYLVRTFDISQPTEAQDLQQNDLWVQNSRCVNTRSVWSKLSKILAARLLTFEPEDVFMYLAASLTAARSPQTSGEAH